MPFGWFKRLAESASAAGSTSSSASFDTWRDPAVRQPAEQWARRQDAYARKAAQQLLGAGVPFFRSQWPRSGQGTFRDAFWLIAVDVELALRSYVEFQPSTVKRQSSGHPPVAKKGEFVGWLRGTGLLLTRSGVLCSADCEGFITTSGRVDDRCMDMLFTKIDRPEWALKSGDWGWNNRGRWRRDPKSDVKVYGADARTQSIRFEERHVHKGPTDQDGRGTSAALSNFVKSGGSVRWPRGFISFDY